MLHFVGGSLCSLGELAGELEAEMRANWRENVWPWLGLYLSILLKICKLLRYHLGLVWSARSDYIVMFSFQSSITLLILTQVWFSRLSLS